MLAIRKNLKNDLNKVLYWREHIWKKIQSFIFYLTYIINLIVQDFIAAWKFGTIIDEIIFHLNDEQIQDIENSINFYN